MSKTNKIFTAVVAGIILLCIIALLVPEKTRSADQLRMEAGLKRIEAMQSDCKTIVQRYSDCFLSKTKIECKQMQDSYAWFTGEYGESPDFACSTIPDPLEFGAVATRK